MKLLKSLLTGLLVVGFAAAASAQTEVYLVGSTAYRGATVKAIEAALSSTTSVTTSGTTGPISTGTFTYGYNGSNEYGATFAIFSGTYNGSWTIVHTHWTGSAAGTVDESVPNLVSFMDDSIVTSGSTSPMHPPSDSAPATTGSLAFTNGASIASGYPTSNHFPSVAMSDSFATSVGKSIASAPASGGTAGTVFQAKITSASLKQAGSLSESVVGILPFVWVAGTQVSGSAPFSNMTQEAAAALIENGFVPVSCLVTSTSSPLIGDTNDYAFLIGRNEDSGTRIAAQAESQVDSNVGKQPFGNAMQQYAVYFSSTSAATGTTVLINSDGNYGGGFTTTDGSNAIETGGTGTQLVDIGLWPSNSPVNTETSLNWNTIGHSGQIGGGDVANVLKAMNPLYLNLIGVDGGGFAPDNWDPVGNGNSMDQSNKAYLIGYLGCADASGIPGVLGKALITGSAGGALLPGATTLTYNGVPYDPTNVQNGLYDFWTFEHMYYNTTLTNAIGSAKTFVDGVCDLLYNGYCQTNSSGVTDPTTVPNSTVGGLKFVNGHYTRVQEGSPIESLF